MGNVTVKPQITDEMVEAVKLVPIYGSNDVMGDALEDDDIRRILTAALSVPCLQEPVAHLVWLQGRPAIDDVVDYYEVARSGDKSVDGSEPFPVYAQPIEVREQATREWQPINTMPKEIERALFFGHTRHDRNIRFTGYRAINGLFYADTGEMCQPSHWQSLPPAPLALLEGR